MRLRPLLLLVLATPLASATEFHVSVNGNDRNDGSSAQPLQTISAAAARAQAGDIITVHAGTYRERVTPPRGGTSEANRIVYRAAPGENAVIKGSEVIRGWKPFLPGVWKVAIPNAFFGKYNPYKELIAGDWFNDRGRPHHTGDVYLNGRSLFESPTLEGVLNPQPFPDARDRDASLSTWHCESDDRFTYIYANFQRKNPNQELVEINVRDSCFYPDRPGRDYITVRGFQMSQAATQWAPPTAEQIGLIGTNWSRGWIIEDNVISDSKCAGVTLGKDRATGQNAWSNDRSKDGATAYNEVIVRALKAGWSREKIGSHVVRNNTIFNCEQAGIAGSLGAVFSRITGNHIYKIWTKRQFAGAEIAGIKLHAAIDVLIRGNRIHNAGRGIWMDWMAQGTRITGNLIYDNTTDDLFVEVDHGPFVVDNNLFLSALSLSDMSEGGAYAHNLITGRIVSRPEPRRVTPYHRAHSTEVVALRNIQGGDDRFYNNVMIGPAAALDTYDPRPFPVFTGGNVYLNGARLYAKETDPLIISAAQPQVEVVVEDDRVFVRCGFLAELRKAVTRRVTTALLGLARVPELPYENADGSALIIDHDYFGNIRSAAPTPGPFENPAEGSVKLRVW